MTREIEKNLGSVEESCQEESLSSSSSDSFVMEKEIEDQQVFNWETGIRAVMAMCWTHLCSECKGNFIPHLADF